jgi:hypothetical protein
VLVLCGQNAGTNDLAVAAAFAHEDAGIKG